MTTWLGGVTWREVLPDVLRALRILPHRVTGVSPYLLLFNSHPKMPDRMELALTVPKEEWATAEQEEELFSL